MLPLRRIRSDLAELRWGQVLVELVLLVLGILIALAVNGWIEDRRDEHAERQYLERLVRDLDADLRMLDEFISFEEKQAADGVLAYRALGRPSAVQDREAVSVALNHLLSRRTLRFTKATYTDLIGTGNVRLIRNGGLRDRIVGLYEGNDRLAAIIDRNNQSFVDQMYAMYLMDTALVVIRPSSNLPILDATLKDLAASAGAIVSVADDRLWKLPPDSQVWDVLRARLWMRTFVSFQAIRQARGVTEQVTAVRQAVIDELARRWPGDTVPPARASAP